MRLLLLPLLVAVSSCAAVHQPAAAQTECAATAYAPDASLQSAIDTALDTAASEGFAGQVAVMRGDVFVYRRNVGAADLQGHIPVRDDTLFQVASITKYITAALTLRAAEQGRLALDAPLLQFIPDTEIAKRGTTIADLLAHRSGLGSSYAAEPFDDPTAALAAIDAAPFDAERAGRFRYSNDGYDVLGIILERLYGERYETIVRHELMARACIPHVGFWGEGRLTDPTYRAQALSSPPRPLRRRSYGMIGSAGFMTTAYDLVAWQHALRAGQVLGPQSLSELWAPRGETSIGQAAYGAFLVDNPRLGRMISARGTEDWGDNAYLNEYLDCDVIVALVTSRGPAEGSGRPLFRDQLIPQIEAALADECAAPAH
ncbi:MAG: serine hydrolase domain-containing protein [Hyphomonadaceae bacterium]